MSKEYILTDEQKKIIERVLDKGKRVELIPLKDKKIKLMQIQRNEIKEE